MLLKTNQPTNQTAVWGSGLVKRNLGAPGPPPCTSLTAKDLSIFP